jgi:hypothetical protein
MLEDKATAPLPESLPGAIPRGWRNAAVTGLLVLHALLCWFSRPAGVITGQDDVEYVSLSQSMRQGGYHEIWRIDAPLHSQYPPGYPALLAAWGLIFGDSYSSHSALSALLSTGALALAYLVVRRTLGDGFALASLAVLAVNPLLIRTGGTVGSEPPFMALSVAALACAHFAARHRRYVVLAVAAAVFAALTRSVGIVLIGTLSLHWLIERRWKPLVALVSVSLVTVGAWMLWTVLAPDQYVGASYVADLRAVGGQANTNMPPLLRRVLPRVQYYLTDAGPFALAQPTIPGTLIDNVVGVLVVWPSFLVGLYMMARRWRSAALYLGLTGALLLAWPWRTERFILPLLPLMVPAILVGAWGLTRWIGSRTALITVGVIAIVLTASAATRSARIVADYVSCRGGDFTSDLRCLTSDQVAYFQAVRYIDEHAPPDAVVLTAKSGALYHYTKRKSVSFLDVMAQGADGFLPYLRERNVEWILMSSMQAESRRMESFYRANCAHLSPQVFFPKGTYVFRILNAPDSTVALACMRAMDVHQAADSVAQENLR